MCATQTQWKFTLKTRWSRCFEVALAYFFRSAPSPISRGRLCSKGQGSKGQGKALLQGFNNARARALARALDKPATVSSRVEEMQVMTFDSCGSCRKAMTGPSPRLFRAMLSFLSGSFVQEAQSIAALAIVRRCRDRSTVGLQDILKAKYEFVELRAASSYLTAVVAITKRRRDRLLRLSSPAVASVKRRHDAVNQTIVEMQLRRRRRLMRRWQCSLLA